MKQILCILWVILMLVAAPDLPAQNRKRDLSPQDRATLRTPLFVGKNIGKLTGFVTRNAETDSARVRAIYSWIAWHIRYKMKVRSTDPDHANPVHVLRRRRAVCAGYANLFERMCLSAGIQAPVVNGYAKGVDYNPGYRFLRSEHAWNVVFMNGRWKLADATWGSGVAVMKLGLFKLIGEKIFNIPAIGKMKIKRGLSYSWLSAHPDEFVQTHLPADAAFQLRDTAEVLENFESVEVDSASLIPVNWEPAVADYSGSTHPLQLHKAGTEGLKYNYKNEFDFANGELALALSLFPEQHKIAPDPEDSTTYKRITEILEAVPPACEKFRNHAKEEFRLRSGEIKIFHSLAQQTFAYRKNDFQTLPVRKQEVKLHRKSLHRWEVSLDKTLANAGTKINAPASSETIRQMKPDKADTLRRRFSQELQKSLSAQDSLDELAGKFSQQVNQFALLADSLELLRSHALKFVPEEVCLVKKSDDYFASKGFEAWTEAEKKVAEMRRRCLLAAREAWNSQRKVSGLINKNILYLDRAKKNADVLTKGGVSSGETNEMQSQMQMELRSIHEKTNSIASAFNDLLDKETSAFEAFKKQYSLNKKPFNYLLSLEPKVKIRLQNAAAFRLEEDLQMTGEIQSAASAGENKAASFIKLIRKQEKKRQTQASAAKKP